MRGWFYAGFLGLFRFLAPRRSTMGQLRDRMEQDLKLKGVSPATIRNYLLYCRKFAAFYMRSPEELGASDRVAVGGDQPDLAEGGAGERLERPVGLAVVVGRDR